MAKVSCLPFFNTITMDWPSGVFAGFFWAIALTDNSRLNRQTVHMNLGIMTLPQR